MLWLVSDKEAESMTESFSLRSVLSQHSSNQVLPLPKLPGREHASHMILVSSRNQSRMHLGSTKAWAQRENEREPLQSILTTRKKNVQLWEPEGYWRRLPNSTSELLHWKYNLIIRPTCIIVVHANIFFCWACAYKPFSTIDRNLTANTVNDLNVNRWWDSIRNLLSDVKFNRTPMPDKVWKMMNLQTAIFAHGRANWCQNPYFEPFQ